MTTDLRPLTLGELFDRAFTLYKRNLWLFVGIIAFPSLVTLVLAIFTQVFQRVLLTVGQSDDPSVGTMVTLGVMIIGIFVLFVVYWVVYMVALGATTYAVAELYVGRRTSVTEAYGGIRRRIGALLVLMLLVGLRFIGVFLAAALILVIAGAAAALVHPIIAGLVFVVGLLAAGLVSFYLMLRYGMSVPALIVESLSPSDAIRRSVDLSHGRLGHLFLLVLCSMVITYAAIAIFQLPFLVGAMVFPPESATSFWLNIVGAVTGTFASAFTTPFLVIGLALLYYDARIREEGFDVELALQALEASDRRPGPAQA